MTPYTIRDATPKDALLIVNYMKIIADEPHNGTSYRSADEYNITPDAMSERLKALATNPGAKTVLALANNQVIGMIMAVNGDRGSVHTASLGITVAQGWRDQGIGSQLMQAVIDWARANPLIHRLDLQVFNNNPGAIRLYERLGFQHEGSKKEAYYKHNEFLDLMQMAMLFERDSYSLDGES